MICNSLSVLLWPGKLSSQLELLQTGIPFIDIVETCQTSSDASGKAGSQQECQYLRTQGKRMRVYSSTWGNVQQKAKINAGTLVYVLVAASSNA